MPENDLLKQLCSELKAAAQDYKSEARNLTAPDSVLMLKLLTNRCESFFREIEQAIFRTNGSFGSFKEFLLNENHKNEIDAQEKSFEQIFKRLEKSESRLECLYRKILQSETINGEFRELLERQSQAILKWHDFIITEEINFILGDEVRIPQEFQQNFYYGSTR